MYIKQLPLADVWQMTQRAEYIPIKWCFTTGLHDDLGVTTVEKIKEITKHEVLRWEKNKTMRLTRARCRIESKFTRIYKTRKVVKFCFGELLWCKRMDFKHSNRT